MLHEILFALLGHTGSIIMELPPLEPDLLLGIKSGLMIDQDQPMNNNNNGGSNN